jgi:hypothetical protein
MGPCRQTPQSILGCMEMPCRTNNPQTEERNSHIFTWQLLTSTPLTMFAPNMAPSTNGMVDYDT